VAPRQVRLAKRRRSVALTIDLRNVLVTAFEQLLTARIEGAIASGTYDVGLETLRADTFTGSTIHIVSRRSSADRALTAAPGYSQNNNGSIEVQRQWVPFVHHYELKYRNGV